MGKENRQDSLHRTGNQSAARKREQKKRWFRQAEMEDRL
jgi:hypothetical protein